MPISSAQVLRRYQTVLRVLSRYGFGYLAGHLGLRRFRSRRGAPGEGRRGERLRQALEELGPAYVKLGQLLSLRSDLLPPDITTALERLQDQVAPVPFDQIQALLEREFGQPLRERFAAVDPKPIAAASLGQVHPAVLPDGRKVVLKVQRPGVAEQVALDLRVIQGLAAMAARRTAWGRRYDLPVVAREFSEMLLAELDFEQEGRNADRFRANFARDPGVRFPTVIWEHTTPRVLTLERVGGLRVTDRAALQAAGLKAAEVAERLAAAVFRMVLRDGFFHADVHPGNLFITEKGVIIFLDMGMVGEITPAMRENVIDYVLGVVAKDSDRVVQAILKMGVVRRPHKLVRLREAVERLQAKYGDIPLREVSFTEALGDTMSLAREFDIAFPSGYAVLLKAMTTLEAVARSINPEATLVGLAQPYAEELMRERLAPSRLAGMLGRELLAAGRPLLRLPRQVSRVLEQVEHGEVRLAVDHAGLDPALRRLSKIANRLALAILLASLIVGTALVASGSERSFLQRYPIADAGFLLIGAVGVWLVVAILRSER